MSRSDDMILAAVEIERIAPIYSDNVREVFLETAKKLREDAAILAKSPTMLSR